MKNNKITNIIVAIILLMGGALLLIFPEDTLRWIILIVGVILILTGLFKLKDYLDIRKKIDATPILLSSILLLLLGVIFVAFTGFVMNFILTFGIVLSIIVGISILFKFVVTITNYSPTNLWKISMFSSTIFLILAIVMFIVLINSNGVDLIRIIGIFFIIEGILALIETLYPSEMIVEIKRESIIIEADIDDEE
ncbi:MAG: DUF308 domain-containing protein [Acholeplasmataceae bacterium]|nr:DUF308 domain-containing protein [Acholeplasmataceae bacterium]